MADLAWRVIRDGARSGVLNMALDESLARTLPEGGAILRFYAWTRPTVSFGRNEPSRDLYSEEEAARLGLEYVRRPTGGRAVLHDAEVTYAVLAPIRSLGGAREGYRRINVALARAMRALGADVETAGDGAAGTARAGGTKRAAGSAGGAAVAPTAGPLPLDAGPCFQSPALGEVVARGRKLVGSAQARIGPALLQHGSIILAGDQSRLALLNPEAAGFQAPATLEELGAKADFDAVAEAVEDAMRVEFGGSWSGSCTSDRELEAAEALVSTRFGRDDWTWRR